MTMKKLGLSNPWLRLAAVLCVIAVAATAAYAAISSDFTYQGVMPFYQPIGGPANVEIFELTLQPGDSLPWHFHPGPAFLVVQQGTLTEEQPCKKPNVIQAGAAFQELPNEIHQVSNKGTVPVILYGSLIYPKFADSDTVFLTTVPTCK